MLVTCGLRPLGREAKSRWRRAVRQLSAQPSKLKHLPTLHYSRGAEAVIIPAEKYTSCPWEALNTLETDGVYSYVTKTNTDRRV